jgi:hypothetical protein
MADKADGDWWAFYRILFDRMAQFHAGSGRDVLVDKRPDYSRDLLSRVYPRLPGVPTLVIVRDPRAVFCSTLSRPSRLSDMAVFMEHYTATMRGASAAAAAGMPVLLMRFEHLVTDPAPHMQAAARFLGLDYTPKMTSPTNSYDQHRKTRYRFDHVQRKPLDDDTIDQWSRQLNPDVAATIVARLPADLTWTLQDRGEDLPSSGNSSVTW